MYDSLICWIALPACTHFSISRHRFVNVILTPLGLIAIAMSSTSESNQSVQHNYYANGMTTSVSRKKLTYLVILQFDRVSVEISKIANYSSWNECRCRSANVLRKLPITGQGVSISLLVSLLLFYCQSLD